jgi:Ca-activated chloride channel family protein
MNRRRLMRAFFAVGAGSFLPGFRVPGFAAEDPHDQPEFTVRSDVRLVVLDVSVKDRKSRFVPDLAKDNFAVFEDGKAQQITVFAHDDLPVTVGILVDESFSMKPKRAEVLAAAEAFIRESNPHDEIFVLNFNDHVRRGLPPQMKFSSDLEQLHAALERGVPEGKTALYDAVEQGLEQLKQGRREKKALVLISDGGDNSSIYTHREIVNQVEGSPATIYTIGIYDEGDPDRTPGLLRQLAEISGGEAYFPQNVDGMTGVCHRIAEDLKVRYTVGYVPQASASNKSAGNNALRHVRVRVSLPGHETATVLARSSYRYDEISEQTTK